MQEERHPSDEALVLKAKKGEAGAFDLLIERHYKRIYKLAFQMLGNSEDAADATQETFVKAFEQLRHFRGDSSFSTWLYRIAINTCRDMIRRNRSIAFSQLQPENENADFDPTTLTEPNLDEIFEERERAELVWTALKQLSEEARQILVLCDMQGFSYAEVAAILNLREGTVKSRLHRARNAFKEVWKSLTREQIAHQKRPKGGDER
ncbi:MAG: RNA polymerase sigma factor [Armatimonadetes bacterium]|nr:RNA polymerase sigma factor [Armatimonadota bacterium]MCX7969218.1 RNA polymerase sigma factor [Armatimonadota bacterium]MDW8143467.1 RNA polymerase sigma factor [Armatimonadota bacterium]